MGKSVPPPTQNDVRRVSLTGGDQSGLASCRLTRRSGHDRCRRGKRSTLHGAVENPPHACGESWDGAPSRMAQGAAAQQEHRDAQHKKRARSRVGNRFRRAPTFIVPLPGRARHSRGSACSTFLILPGGSTLEVQLSLPTASVTSIVLGTPVVLKGLASRTARGSLVARKRQRGELPV